MKLFDLFPEAELNAQLEAKMVRATPHPEAALTIYNYTKVAQFTPELWNHVTDLCRGLIVDAEGNLVARGFEKFWNLDDARHPETLTANLPATPPVLTRKLDGSLGIGYELDVIAAVVLGGTSIFGGSGTIWGTVVGLIMIQLLKDGLALTGVKGDATIVVIGTVLIASTLLASSLQKRRDVGG